MNPQLHYRTFGYFYKNTSGHHCRKYLDIKVDGHGLSHPELIILMLAPGSCGEHDDQELEQEIEVKPDAVVLSIQSFMRMDSLKWVRVLNLSDIEHQSSEMFFKRLENLNTDTPAHSIFHPSRVDELGEHARLETPFFLAWGVDPRSKKLANTALSNIKEKGYKIINEQEPPYHPLVRSTGGIPLWVDYADERYRHFMSTSYKIPGEDKPPAADTGTEKQAPGQEEQIRSAFESFRAPGSGHLIITAAKEEGRWSTFASLLRESALKSFVGTCDYDYAFIEHMAHVKALYELLEKHNGRKIIIDAAASPVVMTMKIGIELLEGAVCSSPDSGIKWKVGQGEGAADKRPFTFTGKIVLLVNESKESLMRNKKFEALLRDCTVI